MNITTANYFPSTQSVDWNAVPASLKKMHETLIPDASKNDWKEYQNDEDIRRTIDKYFGYIAKYVPDLKPTSATQLVADKPGIKTKPARKRTKTVANKKTDSPDTKNAGSVKSVELPEPKQVVVIPTATAFIKRYVALHGKVKTRDQIISLTHGFQKAITEQRIRKDDPAIGELERMQKELLTLLSTMTGSMQIEIDPTFLAHCKHIAQGEEVRSSVKLIKSFIMMSGKAYDKTKAGALLNKMQTAVGKIPWEDPYRKQLIKATETLSTYCKGKDKTVSVPQAFLYGLGSVAAGGSVDGLGIIVSGGGEGAIVRILRTAQIKDLSDRSLKKALRHTAAPGLCLEIARGLIRRGGLSMAVLNAPPSKKKSYWETGIGLAGAGNGLGPPSGGRGIDGIDVLQMQLENARNASGVSGLGNPVINQPPAQRSVAKSRQPVTASASSSSDTVSARELANMTFDTIGYHGQFKNVVGDPATGFRMMVFGKPFQGKSSFVIELCKELAGLGRGKVAYLCLEEGISMSMQKKVIDRGADKVDGLDFKATMPPSFDGYGFVVIDSVSDRSMSREKLREMFLHNPDTCFICIFHATKSGDARGGLDFSHDMDIIIRIDAHQPFVEKNRFL